MVNMKKACKRLTFRHLIICLVITALTASGSAEAQSAPDFAIPWFDISSGGGSAAGASFKVISAIGQPDGHAVSIGGNFKLRGGFLHGHRETSGLQDWALYED